MEVTKKLLMSFMTTSGKRVSISVDDPREDLTEEEIETAMSMIVSKNIFKPSGENLVSLVEAKVIDTNTTEYDLVL